MKLKVFYHILMINDWEKIVKEQLNLIVRSGLYDEIDSIEIGALGNDIEKLQKIVKKYDKADIVRYSDKIDLYEFWTLKIAWHQSGKEKPFYGLYLHTKGVSYPGNEGGKYWRDYMNHYNITLYKESIKKLRKGFDTCGVKMLTKKDRPAFKLHYSGNFFWFKSSYLKRLRDPDGCNQKNRFEAEIWPCEAEPNAATLCQDFVDYNTKGSFHTGVNYVHTLAYNLVTETEKAVKLLYDQNDNFKHYIVDLGFPITSDKIINIDTAKKRNTESLKKLCDKYGSEYLKMDNIGVSQNWDSVYKHLNMRDEDVLIGADPDEHPQNEGWVNAMGDILREGYGLASLMMTDHVPLMNGKKVTNIAGYRCLVNPGSINWALIGMSGKFLKGMGSVPYPKNAERYGWIEDMIQPYFKKLGMNWVILPDFKVRHTDYELGDKGASKLLREWKNLIIFEIRKYGQISFEEFLTRKKNNEL
jgi:hypothetical protein